MHTILTYRSTSELNKHIPENYTGSIKLRLDITHKNISYIIDPCIYSLDKQLIKLTILEHDSIDEEVYDGIQAILRSVLLMLTQCNIS
jgi:hypothetical protein